MEPNTQNNAQNVATDNAATPPEHKKVGPIIAGLVIILIVVIAAIYIFASQTTPSTSQPTDSSATNSAAVESVKPITNTADDTSSLQNDLNQSTSGLDNQNI